MEKLIKEFKTQIAAMNKVNGGEAELISETYHRRMIELNKIYNEDCLLGMKRIPDNTIDLTVTSPPYDNLRTYNGNIAQWSFEKFQAIAKELYRITADGGVVVCLSLKYIMLYLKMLIETQNKYILDCVLFEFVL
jgi:DNA modification methylase